MTPPAIVDAYVHLWNPARFRYSWLDGLPTLNREFPPVEYSQATARANVSKFIFVECGCDSSQSLDEVKWISAIGKVEPRLTGIVAHASLDKGVVVQAELEQLASYPLVKGVRRNLQGKRSLDFCLQSAFIAGLKLLARFNFTFDICIRHEQLPAVAELVQRVPEINFVLDHLGKPDVRNQMFQPWAANLKALASLPNVACKISGLATEADWNHWRSADLKPYFSHALACFGFDRVLFGSDWPVATLAADYQRWHETILGLAGSANEADLSKLFQINAEKIYRV